MGNKKMKNQVILRKLIDDTLSGSVNWVFIGSSKGEHIFIYPECLFGRKYLVVELSIFKNKNKNLLQIYMQNNAKREKFHLKEIQSNTKLVDLSKYVLLDVAMYSDSSEFKEAYDELIDTYD